MIKITRQLAGALVATVCMLFAAIAQATLVEATFEQLSGSTWRVTFVVRNNGTVTVIDSLSIYFDYANASNLIVLSTPGGWDTLALQRDAALQSPAFVDLLRIDPSQGIIPGTALAGLSVQFDWFGSGPPASFTWTVNDANSFAVLGRGSTVNGVQVAAIPEPSTYLLLISGLVVVTVSARRSNAKQRRQSLAASLRRRVFKLRPRAHGTSRARTATVRSSLPYLA